MWQTVIAVGQLPVYHLDLNVARSWAQFLVEVVAVVGLVVAFRKRSDRRLTERIKELVETRTEPIQPGYRNGGESLGDIAAEVRTVRDEVRTVRAQVRTLTSTVDANRVEARRDLRDLRGVVEANAEAAAALGVALQSQQGTDPAPGDGADLD